MDPAENAKWQMLHQCWSAGHWERMEALGRDLLLNAPSDAELLCAVGVAVFQLERREEGRRFFEEAITNDPDHAPSHAWMGWYWVRKRRFGRAEQSVQRALAIDPVRDDYWVDLGRIMLMQGNHRGARACAAKALAIDGGNVSAVALDADAEGAGDGVGQASLDERGERIETALSQEPENADLHEALGDLLQDAGRVRQAEERYREALALDPSRPWLWRKVRRMGLKRDWVDAVLSAPWRLGLWLIGEREFITIFLGFAVCAGWAVLLGPVAFLYRLLFRVELEFLAARGTREVRVSLPRRVLRFVLLGVAGGSYWCFVWWLSRQDGTWWFAGWGIKVLLAVLVAAGLYLGLREVLAEARHRRALQELEGDEG